MFQALGGYNYSNFAAMQQNIPFGYQNACFINPMQQTCPTIMGQQAAYAQGAAQRVSDEIKNIGQSLAQAKYAISSAMQSKDLSEEDKNALQEELKKIEAKEQELTSTLRMDMSVDDVRKEKNSVQELVQQVMMAVQNKVAAAQKAKAEQAAQGDGTSTDGTDGADGSADGAGSVKVGDTDVDPETGRPASLDPALDSYEAASLAFQVKQAVECPGTNHDILDPIVQNLNASNIVEIVKAWEGKHGTHSKEGNDGFFARIFDDVNDSWQNENVPIMLSALVKRAEAAGIKQSEIEEYIGNVHSAMAERDWTGLMEWHDDHKIANNLMEIYNKIVEKEAALATNAGKIAEEDKKKAEAEEKEEKQKEENAIKETKAQFLADMREIWKDEKLEIADKVRYEDGKFQIRIEGNEYSGNDFNALVKAVEDGGYDAKKYLCKQKVDTKA